MRARAIVLLLPLFSAVEAIAAIPDARFTQSPVVQSGIASATGLARAPDGSNRIFVITKDGNVRIVENGSLLAGNFATLTPIYTGSECGLIGIAFDPDYATNRYVYFFVTVSSSEQQIIRYTDNNNQGIDKTTVVPNIPTIGANHDGGGIGFGPDGYLYWSTGDNGSGRGVNNDLTLLASKVGRAHPDGTVPMDNPFYDGAGGNNDYIWARGLRNPFTLTFEPGRGRLWVNSVGSSYEQIFIVRAGDHAGWSNHENTQPANFIQPVISYRTNSNNSFGITANGAVRANGTITITTNSTHGFHRGEKITLSGVSDASFNGSVFVADVPSTTTFTALQAGADLTAGSGNAATQDIGGCVSGGTFYEGTDFPAEFAGNFMFGDYNSDRLMRAVLDSNGDVASVDTWGTGFSSIIDMETGPDGALYILTHGGSLQRATFNHSAQALVLSATQLRTVEGGRIGFSVRLATEPSSNVTVTVRNSGADPDVTIESGATLTFSNADWDRPQAVMLYGGLDFDTAEDATTISVESAGLTTQNVAVTVRDLNSQSIVVSTTSVEVREGSSGMFGVFLSDIPDVPITITVTSTSPKVLIAGGASELTFNELNYSVPQQVTIATFEDQDAISELASILVSSREAAARVVTVRIRDNDTTAPLFTSTPPTTGIEGARYEYDADATGLPAPMFFLDDSPSGVIFDPVTGVMSFLPFSVGTYIFRVVASNGIAPDAVQSWSVEVAEDAAPTAMIVKPAEGATLSGTMNDWYGNGTDDVGLIRADFAIDGTVVFSETSTLGRYNFNGGANRFDTTTLSNGPHTLKMTILDTKRQTASAEVRVTVQNQVGSGDAGLPGPGGGDEESGCSCKTAPIEKIPPGALWLILAAALILRPGSTNKSERRRLYETLRPRRRSPEPPQAPQF